MTLTLFNLIASPKVNELEGRFIYKAYPKDNEDFTTLTIGARKFPNPTIQSLGKVELKRFEQRRNTTNIS